jgi:hypothetical protein
MVIDADYKICRTMDLTDVINHLLSFALPALSLAIGLPLVTNLTAWGRTGPVSLRTQFLVNIVVALAALLAGLWFWGHDGRMATYLAMAIVCGSAQWLVLRGWRR